MDGAEKEDLTQTLNLHQLKEEKLKTVNPTMIDHVST